MLINRFFVEIVENANCTEVVSIFVKKIVDCVDWSIFIENVENANYTKIVNIFVKKIVDCVD